MNNILDYDIIRQPKTGLGYGFRVSTARVWPVTGREWVFHATDEEMAVLQEIERSFGRIDGENYGYSFFEVHDLRDGEWFDGWTVSCFHRKICGLHKRLEYEGMPESWNEVLAALRLAYIGVRQEEERRAKLAEEEADE